MDIQKLQANIILGKYNRLMYEEKNDNTLITNTYFVAIIHSNSVLINFNNLPSDYLMPRSAVKDWRKGGLFKSVDKMANCKDLQLLSVGKQIVVDKIPGKRAHELKGNDFTALVCSEYLKLLATKSCKLYGSGKYNPVIIRDTNDNLIGIVSPIIVHRMENWQTQMK